MLIDLWPKSTWPSHPHCSKMKPMHPDMLAAILFLPTHLCPIRSRDIDVSAPFSNNRSKVGENGQVWGGGAYRSTQVFWFHFWGTALLAISVLSECVKNRYPWASAPTGRRGSVGPVCSVNRSGLCWSRRADSPPRHRFIFLLPSSCLCNLSVFQ